MMQDSILRVLAETKRVKLLFKALKAFGLVILSFLGGG